MTNPVVVMLEEEEAYFNWNMEIVGIGCKIFHIFILACFTLTHVDKRTPCWEMAHWWVSSTRPSNHETLDKAPLDKVKRCIWINILMKVGGIRSGWNQQMNLHRLVGPFCFLQRLVAFS